MPDREGFTRGEDYNEQLRERLEKAFAGLSAEEGFTTSAPRWTEQGTPWTDPGPPAHLTERPFYDDPFIKEGESWMSPREFYSRDFTPDEFFEGRAQFGNRFQSAGPLTQERYQRFAEAGFPGVDVGSFFEPFGGGKRPSPMAAAPPAWLSKVYQTGPSDTMSSVISRARQGVKDWLSGGPDAPRILTPREWEDMLPSERQGLMGFLDFIGIPWDDYSEMMQRQQESVTQAFGIETRFRPARQR